MVYGYGKCFAILGFATALALPGVAPAQAPAADIPIVFESHVLPILKSHCLKCHGEGKVKGGLDLRSMAAILSGGDTGPGIVAGKPQDSILIRRIESGDMPPPKQGKLDKKHIDTLRRWIREGALAKNNSSATEEAIVRIGADERNFWAFQSPKRPALPKVKSDTRVRTSIDAFVLARLQPRGLNFNPDAGREVILRRLCFDLLGLPPSMEQQREFLADTRADAYDRLVDRLLSSPAYGERWDRHWLDLAGYADSDGYLAADRLRLQAYRYRDYVIQALNTDMPYDQFVAEQLAGDQLSDWRHAEKLTPAMVRQLTATGYLRTASDPTYPGYTEPNEIHQVISDTMQIVGSTFLGLTVHCARCHSHKLEPISQHDYSALQAVFLPALDPARWQPSEVRGITMASAKELAGIRTHNQKINADIARHSKELAELNAKYRKQRQAEEPGKKLDPKSSLLSDKELAARYPDFKAQSEKLGALIAAEKSQVKTEPPKLRALADLDGKCPEGRVLRRGDYNKPGAIVQPGVLEVLAPAGYKLPIAEKPGARRLALAKWLTGPNHPLTARVHVNRIWANLFGKGIVPTVANFGKSGARPSHPELLDWLATEFIRSGWSQKHMIRLMVTSTAYRQGSQLDAARKKADPGNVLLSSWRPRRLTGEVLRDSVLSVSGKLNEQRFGPPAPVAVRGDGSVETSDDPQGNRRSIYVIVRRSQHLTLLDLFDTPMMEINCPERNVSTVPLQALALMHGPFVEKNAAALAERIVKSGPTDDARIVHAYRLLLGRAPRSSEVDALQTFLSEVTREHAGKNAPTAQALRAAWTQAALVLLNSNEFVYVN